MDIFGMIDDLHLCYQVKASTVEQYLKLDSLTRNTMCEGVRREIIKYANSDKFTFYNITKQLHDSVACKIILFYLISESN